MNRFPAHRAGRRRSAELQTPEMVEGHVRKHPVGAPDPGSALDLSVQDELHRGQIEGVSLSRPTWRVLALMVAHELRGTGPLAEVHAHLASAGWTLAGLGHRRRLESLVRRGLARRSGPSLRVTVAGFAAVFSASARYAKVAPPWDLLRDLRREELRRH
jgi:hypothetical protein